MAVRLIGEATLIDGRLRRASASGTRRSPPSARRGRGRLQRGDAPRRRYPGDHARGARRRGDRDGIGRGRGHGLDRRHAPGRASSRTTPPGGRSRSFPRASSLSPSTSGSRSTTGPGVLAQVAERLAAHGVSVARLIQHDAHGRRSSTSSRTRHPPVPSRRRSPRSRRSRDPRRPTRLTVISDRGVTGLG